MSAAESPDLTDELVGVLAPEGAPSDAELSAATDPAAGEHPWRPTDLASADWVGRKAAKAHEAIVELQEQRDRIVAQADAWLDRERRRHDRTLEWAETVLRNWLDAEIAADDSKKPRKSRELPSGVTVKRISGRPSLAVDDEAALVDWLKDHRPDLVEAQVKWVWSKTDVRKLAGDDGTIRVVDEETGEVSHAPASVKVGEDRYTVEVGR